MKVKPPTVFWGNERVSHEAIIAVQQAETLLRLKAEEQVLLVQDTTSFNFSHHPATTGLGSLENAYCRGFLAHSTLAVSRVGVPLGLLAQQVWTRRDEETGKRQQRHQRPFEDKESYKWVQGLPPAGGRQGYVVVCDAEAHIYEFLDTMVAQGLDFIVRAADARAFTETGQPLFASIAHQTVQQRLTLALKRRPDRAARTAELELRFSPITLKRPRRARAERETLTVVVVDVIEPQPPAGEHAVHWVLVTSLPVQTVAQAQQISRWYSYRWLVERFHYVLKSGCKLEESQLRQAAALERLLAVYSGVAWQLLWLTYQSRQTPEIPCTVALQPAEWQALYAFIHHTQTLPHTAPSLRQAIRWIGQLGGFLGRTSDGEPGVKVLWRGWTRLQDIVQTWSLFHPSQDVGNA
jgi:Transposase Tn5 dimerisation domain